MTSSRRRRYAELCGIIREIPCPTLVVCGAESNVFLEEDAEKLVGIVRAGHSVAIPHARHTIQGDNPAGLVTVLRSFLDDVTGVRRHGG